MPTAVDLFEQLRPRLKAISLRIVGSDAEAEDVVQDCFLKWHGAEQQALTMPAAWLTTVVRHQSIDRLRRRARDAMASHIALEMTPQSAPTTPDDRLLRQAELAEALARLLALSPAERLALVLHEVFEREHADIAATLGSKAANARQHLSRARRRLREDKDAQASEQQLNRDLVQRFHAAIHELDAPTVVRLLTDVQPQACANDACYRMAA
ncbi:sigma-70 family RNA polymerase sigma factor [Duganella sp. sic0402]|uniref:sigma-70 family RNA polymerase sigma factor n=1 Tax=Duganella sp. sic0402 TaxID=2854786 RepID=UPI001C48B459|nr:sigma-70 family RNA polymerase sigma factor [Duganella sp. sic0402]MBV7537763.1 sigma-70 family RNA polymerase sigma factor [Duganella sp. sic0402]